ncbi:MAG: DUF3747 domain-containing protein [Acaryochloridaceae cyanobacterium SU_2_1]|nr:DUF3747 domain-containing protein [Acaryochloridaceae cyanobacterium SU_2_1]
MKTISLCSTVAIASLTLGLLVPDGVARAAEFGQQEVDQSKFVAIAVPFAEGKQYNLIILEQLSTTKPCWQENALGNVDPLLLQFDFTGICSRSTDSNGYSIRQAGQDFALDYRLSIQKQADKLILVGHPLRNAKAPPLKIGETQSAAAGFLKIKLDPQWRLTKRTYNSNTLGHVYFTRDTIAPTAVAVAEPAERVSEQQLPQPKSKISAAVPPATASVKRPLSRPAAFQEPIEISVPEPQLSPPSSPALITARSHSPSALPNLSSDDSGVGAPDPLGVPLAAPNINQSRQNLPNRRIQTPGIKLAAQPPLSKAVISRPIQIPVPEPLRHQRQAILTPPAPSLSPSLGEEEGPVIPGLNADLLPVPKGLPPLGSYDPDSDIYIASRDGGFDNSLDSSAPPPPPLDQRSRLRYRVVVKTADASQISQVKALVPDAFRSSYQGLSVWQVGAYENQQEADERIELLEREGIQSIMEAR